MKKLYALVFALFLIASTYCYENLPNVDFSKYYSVLEGQQIPVLSDEKVNVVAYYNNEPKNFKISMKGNTISKVEEGQFSEPSIAVFISNEATRDLYNAKSQQDKLRVAKQLYKDGKIKVKFYGWFGFLKEFFFSQGFLNYNF